MLRREIIEKLRDERYLYSLLRPMAMDKDCIYPISLSNSEINSLRSEITVFYRKWLSHGYVGTLTSHSRYSFVYAEKLAYMARKKLMTYVRSFQSFAAHRDVQTCGYSFTVNPKDLHYWQTKALNRQLIRLLRKNKKVVLIQKEVENTYYHCGNNVHLQYFVLSAQSLPHRKIERAASRIGKQITGTVTKSKLLKFNDVSKAAGYSTKQFGLPLPLKHRKNDPLDQFHHFIRLPIRKQMHLLAEDINGSKGIEKHRMYINRNNDLARDWWYGLDHGDLMLKTKQTDENEDLTDFNCTFDQLKRKLYNKAHGRVSNHNKSLSEMLGQFYFGDTYYFAKQRRSMDKRRQQTSLFE